VLNEGLLFLELVESCPRGEGLLVEDFLLEPEEVRRVGRVVGVGECSVESGDTGA
jgi:hypothetical protein